MSATIILSITFVFGLCLGSFLNVCIYRLPRDEDPLEGRSRCPSCGEAIAWFDNVPLFSYLVLGGECRECGSPISFRYPVVELVSAVLLSVGAWRWLVLPPGFEWLNFIAGGYLLLVSLAIVLIDIEFSIIPNELTYTLIVSGLAAGLFHHYPLATGGVTGFAPEQFPRALAGGLVGGGVFFLLALISPLIYGRQALGMGDVKLLAGYGAWLGTAGALFIIVFGSLVGAVVGTSIMLFRGRSLRNEIPFGPFLCLAGVVYIFLGPWLVDWYLRMAVPA